MRPKLLARSSIGPKLEAASPASAGEGNWEEIRVGMGFPGRTAGDLLRKWANFDPEIFEPDAIGEQ